MVRPRSTKQFTDKQKAHFARTAAAMKLANENFQHERRCKAQWKGAPCKYWALANEDYCKRCGRLNRNKRTTVAGTLVTQQHGMTREEMNFYSRRLGPRLKARIEEIEAATTGANPISLRDELMLMRDVAGRAVACYSSAEELPDNAPNKAELQGVADKLMLAALREVRVMCKTAAEVEELRGDKYDIHTLNDIVAQICGMVHRNFGFIENIEPYLIEFERQIKEELVLPKSGTEGTDITPDADVLAMDDTIPRAS